MPKHKYIPNPKYLFEGNLEEDDVDDAHFINSFRSRFPFQHNDGLHNKESESQHQLILDKKRAIEQRTLESSAKSLRLLHESEEMGITAAQELVCQHETLTKVNKKLDEMNPKLISSQKHLNGMNSIFYSLKSYFTSKSDPGPSNSQDSNKTRSASPSSKPLNRTLDKLTQERSETTDKFNNHPSTRLRDIDDQVLAEPITDSKHVDDALEANLNNMGQVITRMKDLGLALGEEIDEQNELIGTINDKVEETEIRIGNQNVMIKKLL